MSTQTTTPHGPIRTYNAFPHRGKKGLAISIPPGKAKDGNVYLLADGRNIEALPLEQLRALLGEIGLSDEQATACRFQISLKEFAR